jgi:ribosomal protein L16 Arg81 hydroxylase
MIDIDRIEGLIGYSKIPDDWISEMIAELRKLRAELNDFTTAAGEMNQEVVRLREKSRLMDNACCYADSLIGMLRQGGWSGKADALEARIKAVIDFDKEHQ